MKIQIISDLHLEFLSLSQVEKIIANIQSVGDILVLAGDIGHPDDSSYVYFLEQMNNMFSKIFLITGNHEYYGGNIQNTNIKIQELCLPLKNISFLSSSYEDYLGFRWIGTTLWSHIEPTAHIINDIRKIRQLSIKNYNELHQESVNFINNILEENMNIPSIIITHHLPSYKLINPRYQTKTHNKYNQWFASNLDELIEKYKPSLWIYGHTHDFSHSELYQTQMVCNPLGYEDENTNTNFNYTVELFHN